MITELTEEQSFNVFSVFSVCSVAKQKSMKIKTLSFSLFCCLVLLLGIETLFSERSVIAQRGGKASSFTYGGGEAGQRYSPLRQINRSNVQQLEIAWTYDGGDGAGDSQNQPVIVDGVLFGATAKHKIFALDAATGKELWRFDSGLGGRGPNRGVSV